MSPDAGSTDPIAAVRDAVAPAYTVERLLGQGGMGAVYLGRDVTLDRPVAIKVINPDVAGSGLLRDRFLQEARSVARLRHPNIVSVYTAGESNGVLYFAMELVEGESLRELMARGIRLPVERSARIIAEIALALDHAHSHGLVHRDIKPDNILIESATGRALLTDFGVARAGATGDASLTQTGMIVGSPRYMSPEQISGEGAVDGRSDLYALALVGYELFSGKPAVQSGSVQQIIYKHLTETPPPLDGVVAGIPPAVSAAIAKGLEKDPGARWQTGAEFAQALGGTGVVTPTSPWTPGPLPAGSSGKRKSWLPIAAIVAALLALAIVFGLGSDDSGNDAYLVTPFEIQSGDPAVTWLREASVNMLTLTLGQWNDLNVVDYERTLSLLDAEGMSDKRQISAEDAFALARRANAGTVVTGQIMTINDSLFVTATRYDVRSQKSERQATASMPRNADPRDLFDRLAQQLLDIEGFNRASTVQIARATTSSLAAYRAYLDGVKLLNSWRLREADAEFAKAISIDSTFALAFHKRALGLGWNQAGGPEYLESSHKAFTLMSRLPPREQSLVKGHHYLALALAAVNANDSVSARQNFDASIAAYTELMARNDTLVAEAWYGLADSYYHARMPSLTPEKTRQYTTESLRGFNRTLAIDSTYHLAYSHLVSLYNAAATGSNLVIQGDTAILLDSASVARLGSDGVTRHRDFARARGLAIASAWARTDQGSTQAVVQLSQSYASNNQLDSAVRVLRQALTTPRSGAPLARINLLIYEELADDTGSASTLNHILTRFTPDSLREASLGVRFNAEAQLMGSAAMQGRHADIIRAAKLFAATDSVVPFSTVPTKPIIDFLTAGLELALGDTMTPARRRTILGARAWMDSLPLQFRDQMRGGAVAVPYVAFLATHDTAFRRLVQDWAGSTQLTELDAAIALDRGDTATARSIAMTFPKPDSLRNARFGIGGMRSVARAEVLERLGLQRQAVETYEATTLDRINRGNIGEPGLTVWVRSWYARARLWEQLGERDKAVKAYEEFIRRWSRADGAAAKLVAQAKVDLGRLRDSRQGR